jgi:predicted nucleic acid-binding protein
LKYWDSSALVALHVSQARTPAVRELWTADPVVVTWLFSDIEIRSALMRLERDGDMVPEDTRAAMEQVDAFWRGVHVVSLIDAVKLRAKRLLSTHPLKAADALQLGAALAMVKDNPVGRAFVCLDQRLGECARREGFTVLP